MKTTIIILALALLCGLALADGQTVDSLRCKMIDWLDAPTNHNFGYGGTDDMYGYSGTAHWDLAMGDSFMVWLPGSRVMIFVDPYNSAEIDTVIDPHSGSEDIVAATVRDSVFFTGGGVFMYSILWERDSISLQDEIFTGFANYHYAALEDSFLYTINANGAVWTCINVADPESIFIYRSYGSLSSAGSSGGLEVIDGYAYGVNSYSRGSTLEPPYRVWAVFDIYKIDMLNSATAHYEDGIAYEDRNLGSITSDGTYIYYANTVVDGWPDWTIGESYLYVWDTDTSYDFDSKWDDQGVFGIEVLNEHLLAAGFAHGFSVLNIDNLDSIYEVAYYLDEDSTMDLTHFALKENRLYAMGHPRSGYARLYMFELDDGVVTGQAELDIPWTPDEMRLRSYPNPFNSSVKFAMDFMPDKIEIYDLSGRQVAEILDSRLHGNDSEYIWTPKGLPSGIYFARAKKGDISVTVKLVYLQ